MKKHLLLGILGACALSSQAQTFKEWQDPEVNAVNRAPMHTNFLLMKVWMQQHRQSRNILTIS